MFGLRDLLLRFTAPGPDGRDRFFDAPNDHYCSAGYWCTVAARARKERLTVDDLNIWPDAAAYAQAIGIEAALNQEDHYPFDRVRRGKTYSPLTVIDGPEYVDEATGLINGCVRALFPEHEHARFVANLCEVIGDLHDNVWSHGKSTGISAAQCWHKPYTAGNVRYIEFGLADCGYGFLRELERAGVAQQLGICSHQEAIEWCIEKGHSSKATDYDDGWTQRLPDDVMGNPIGRHARVATDGNHHVGIGLFKLTNLVQVYGGELWMTSGDVMLQIDAKGVRSYVHTSIRWDGVALACRFATDSVATRAAVPDDELEETLLKLVEGEDHG